MLYRIEYFFFVRFLVFITAGLASAFPTSCKLSDGVYSVEVHCISSTHSPSHLSEKTLFRLSKLTGKVVLFRQAAPSCLLLAT